MPEYGTNTAAPVDLGEHPAVQAWAKLRRVGQAFQPDGQAFVGQAFQPDGQAGKPDLRAGWARPREVVRLQKKKKGHVYRLAGAGPGGSDVIAKRSSPERIRGERAVYEQVLPALPVPTVRYYGAVEDPEDGCGWLFLEDADGEAYSPLLPEHRALAGRWLALLHTSAARCPAAGLLPDRGPGYYYGHLRSARDTIIQNLSNPALTPEDVSVLEAVVRQCEVVAARWDEVEGVCAGAPRTFIHGDFAPKNMRLRAGPAGAGLLPFDWGSAGWGVPAADLAQAGGASWHYWASPDLSAYRFAVGESWPHLGARDLQALAAVGKVFRCLVCIDLDARSLATEWVEHSVRNMRVYRAELADALQAAGWEGGPGR